MLNGDSVSDLVKRAGIFEDATAGFNGPGSLLFSIPETP